MKFKKSILSLTLILLMTLPLMQPAARAAEGWGSSISGDVIKPDGIPVLTFDTVPEKGQQFELSTDIVNPNTAESRGFHVRTSGGISTMLDANYYPYSQSVGGSSKEQDEFLAGAITNPSGVDLSSLSFGASGNANAFTDYAIKLNQQKVTGRNNTNSLRISANDVYMITYCAHLCVTNDWKVLAGASDVWINGGYQDVPEIQVYSKYHWWHMSNRYDYSVFTTQPSDGVGWDVWGGSGVDIIGNTPIRNTSHSWKWQEFYDQWDSGQAAKSLITILDVNTTTKEAVVLIVLPALMNITDQSGATLMKMNWELAEGYLTIKKASANSSVTEGNSQYTFNGIKIGVYTNQACTTLAKETDGTEAVITIDASGDPDRTLSLSPGNYWIKEISVPEDSGYVLNTTAIDVTVTYNQTQTKTVTNEIQTIPLTIKKASTMPTVTNGNKNYTFEGIKIGVYTNQACTTLAKDTSGKDAIVTMKADGTADKILILPKGSYWVKEISVPANCGYELCTDVNAITQKTGVVTTTIKNAPKLSKLTVNKASATSAYTDGNNSYSFNGTKIGVYTNQACTTLAKDSAGRDAIVTINAAGNPDKVLSLAAGSYWVKEISVPESSGYRLNTTANTVTLAAGGSATSTIKNTPVSDPMGLSIQKVDGNGKTIPSDNLAGAQYTIKYYAGQYTKANLPATPDATWVIETKKDGSAYRAWLKDGYVISGDGAKYGYDRGNYYRIPLGTLTIEETKAPAGFTITGSKMQLASGNGSDATDGVILVNIVSENSTVMVRSGNQVSSAEDGFEILQKEKAVPSQATVKKVDGAGNPIAGVVFSLKYIDAAGTEKTEQKTTGADGTITWTNIRYNSPATLKEISVPAGYKMDSAAAAGLSFTITGTLDNGIYKYNLGTIKNEKITVPVSVRKTSDDNVVEGFTFRITGQDVFGASVNKTATTNKNGVADFGAIYYGSYTVTEELTADQALKYVNEGPWTFTVDAKTANPYVITAKNYRARITTKASASLTGIGLSFAGPATITDMVFFYNLVKGDTYTLRTSVHDAVTGDVITDAAGVKGQFENNFTASSKDGSTNVSMYLNLTGFAGRKLVIFQELYKNGVLVADHNVLSDENQSIYVPGLKTTATADDTKDHVTKARETITITDVVSFTNLKPGLEYEFTGTLMDKVSGDPILDDEGNQITASTLYTPTAPSGTVNLTFTFKGVSLAGKTLVAFESVSYEGKNVAVHADLNDEGQTVYIPELKTTATADDTNDHVTKARETITISDVVAFTNLKPGLEYEFTGALMDKVSGDPILDDEGNQITASTLYTPTAPSGTVNLTFTFKGVSLAGKALVAFESVAFEGTEVAVHADLNDEDQTVYIPELKTTATADDTNDHVTKARETITITDVVAFTNLKPGLEYEFFGQLMDKATGDPVLDDEGNQITASTLYTPTAPSGTVELAFTFKGITLSGKTLVAFESVAFEGTEVAVHADLNDEDQTVYIPELKTTATADDTADHVTMARESISITDVVSFTNLKPGKEYEFTGILMDKATGDPVLDDEGNQIAASTLYTPTAPSGTVELTFSFKGVNLAGKTLVAFETVLFEGTEVAVHADLNDEDQTVYIPELKTTATADDTADHVTKARETISITDVVSFTNLKPGKEYEFTGTLMDKATGDPVLDDEGNQITASTLYTPTAPSGTVELTFRFPGVSLAGKTLVAFESVAFEGTEVAVHADLNDEDQTVYIPKIGTKAQDQTTGSDHALADGMITIIDTVRYEGLKPGLEYEIFGAFHFKENGAQVTENGGAAMAWTSASFTPDSPDGEIKLTFTFNANSIKGRPIVAFESLRYEGVEIASHTDINDEDQTIYLPKIRTRAFESINQLDLAKAGGVITITDRVYYDGLKPGMPYSVFGKFYDKATGAPAKDFDGKEITGSIASFTPDSESGYVDISFSFNAKGMEGKTIVAYETLLIDGLSGKEVAIDADINNVDQTIYFPSIGTVLTARESGMNHVKATDPEEDIYLYDSVKYENLKPGRTYTLTGSLVYKDSGEPVPVENDPVQVFTPDAPSGEALVVFVVKAKNLIGTGPVVAFESLRYEGVEIAAHADITDEAQTVYTPSITTDAKDKETGTDHAFASETITIVDVVTYEGLKVGKEYTVEGILMDPESGEPYEEDGKTVTATVTFTPDAAVGSVELEFVVSGKYAAGRSLVVFESLITEGKEVAIHADITDEDQTVHIPQIKTTAAFEDGSKNSKTGEMVTVIDRIDYKGLKVGEEYTFEGILMVVETGKALLDGEKEVTASLTITVDQPDGFVELKFSFDAAALEGKTLVVFEELKKEDITVAVHKELTDLDQQVSFPSVLTVAKDKASGTKTVTLSRKAVVIDIVTFKGLIPGKEYSIYGVLMDKATGKPILIDDKAVAAALSFTPDQPDGSVELSFTFDAYKVEGKTLVVFETIKEGEKEIAAHTDIEDENQTVMVPKTPPHVEMGDRMNFVLPAACFTAAGAGAALVAKKAKTKKEEETHG